MEWNGMSSGFVEKRDPDQMDGRYEVVGWVGRMERTRAKGKGGGRGERTGGRASEGRGRKQDQGSCEVRGVVESVIVMRMMSGR